MYCMVCIKYYTLCYIFFNFFFSIKHLKYVTTYDSNITKYKLIGKKRPEYAKYAK